MALLAVAAQASACRCAPRPLADYFADADLVIVGRAMQTWIDPDDPQRRRVRFDVSPSPYKGEPTAFADLATPTESASCGYAVEVGRPYVVFAVRYPDDRLAWFDTCTGTRPVAGAADFVDVPAAAVLPRLNALRGQAGSDPRTTATAVLPLAGDPNARLIGLLEPGLPDPDRVQDAEREDDNPTRRGDFSLVEWSEEPRQVRHDEPVRSAMRSCR